MRTKYCLEEKSFCQNYEFHRNTGKFYPQTLENYEPTEEFDISIPFLPRKGVRVEAYEKFRDIGKFINGPVASAIYWTILSKSKFVVSPPGTINTQI